MDQSFSETKIKLCSDDQVWFFTDGVIDLQNGEGKVWGERNFIKSLLLAASCKGAPEVKVENMLRTATEFRGEASLVDDMTFFVCQLEEVQG